MEGAAIRGEYIPRGCVTGTPEQKARRADYAAKLESALGAGQSGQWTTDAQLRDYLNSIGSKGNALYNQLYSKGGYATYGPSWDPGRNFDFNTGENIPWQGAGETWYDPSVASNWQKTDPTQAARMSGFYDWRNQNGDMIDQRYGGNALAAWLQMRAKSSRPNSPDMSWFNEPGGGAHQPPGSPPGGTSFTGEGGPIPPFATPPGFGQLSKNVPTEVPYRYPVPMTGMTGANLGSLSTPPTPGKTENAYDWANYSYSPF